MSKTPHAHRLALVLAALTALAVTVADPAAAQDKGKLRFDVGRDFDLVATTDWAGISVALAQVDCATDFDRNRNAMIESGKLGKDATKIVWQSDPLPNDAIAVPKSFDPALAKRIQQILLEIAEAQAKTILPNHYTGFVAATHESYKTIEDAGVLVGRILLSRPLVLECLAGHRLVRVRAPVRRRCRPDFLRLLTILVLILIMVTVIDQGSQWLRQRLN